MSSKLSRPIGETICDATLWRFLEYGNDDVEGDAEDDEEKEERKKK